MKVTYCTFKHETFVSCCLCCVWQTVLSAKAEGESRMEKLKEAGHRLAHRPGLGESLKLDIMQTVSYTEVHWGAVLQSADQHRR